MHRLLDQLVGMKGYMMNKESPDGMLAFPSSIFTFIVNPFSYSSEFSSVADQGAFVEFILFLVSLA
jgi:hypothetical protein